MIGRVLKAAAAYFALVFAAGFALGTVRTLWLAPTLGPVLAVAAELPVMLTVSWLACGFVLRRTPLRLPEAVAAGAIAFVLLLLAEAALSMTLGGLTLQQHLALYREAANLLGLAGQVAFAVIPALRNTRTGDRRRGRTDPPRFGSLAVAAMVLCSGGGAADVARAQPQLTPADPPEASSSCEQSSP